MLEQAKKTMLDIHWEADLYAIYYEEERSRYWQERVRSLKSKLRDTYNLYAAKVTTYEMAKELKRIYDEIMKHFPSV